MFPDPTSHSGDVIHPLLRNVGSGAETTLLLLKDVLVQCMVCHRDVKAGCYEGHECTPSLTAGEKREAAALLK